MSASSSGLEQWPGFFSSKNNGTAKDFATGEVPKCDKFLLWTCIHKSQRYLVCSRDSIHHAREESIKSNFDLRA
jgi:hypothetical protein